MFAGLSLPSTQHTDTGRISLLQLEDVVLVIATGRTIRASLPVSVLVKSNKWNPIGKSAACGL